MLTNKQQVINHLLQDPFYEEVLKKYLKKKSDLDEFRQELWIILLEMKDNKLIQYYDSKVLKYIYIGIINNQIKSKTSPWHRKFRAYNQINNTVSLDPTLDFNYEDKDFCNDILKEISKPEIDFIKIKKDNELKIKYIEDKLIALEIKDKYLLRDISVFKMHFYNNMSYRQISEKTHISLTSVWTYINNIKYLLKKDKIEI